METPIVDVELVTDYDYPVGDSTKLPNPYFKLTHEDGSVSTLVTDGPDIEKNRHYRELADWYKNHPNPPFQFEFKEIVDPRAGLEPEPTQAPAEPEQVIAPTLEAQTTDTFTLADNTGDGFVNNQTPPPSGGLSVL